jgi:15-cis-phytoene synthase
VTRTAVSLDESYVRCRALNRRYGSTYFWSTHLLPPAKRKHVHALYAFCRYADDIVDLNQNDTEINRHKRLNDFGDLFFDTYEANDSGDPILTAVVNTARELNIDPDCFRRFMRSMGMDFDHDTYATFDDLMEYMDGSAAVIGEMMLPVLEPLTPDALEPARALGVAFQLTNFLRDVGEDLDRRRVYIPQETLHKFDVDPYARSASAQWASVMQFEIDRTRSIYEVADQGVAMLPPKSAKCVKAARDLYSGILRRIEQNGYDVFTKRARVPHWRKLAAAVSLI